jgi:hypothetical protein
MRSTRPNRVRNGCAVDADVLFIKVRNGCAVDADVRSSKVRNGCAVDVDVLSSIGWLRTLFLVPAFRFTPQDPEHVAPTLILFIVYDAKQPGANSK